jgi:hypothetical protein
MPFVSITRLRVRRWRYLPQFLIQSIRAARQAKRAPGNIAVSILRDANRRFLDPYRRHSKMAHIGSLQ